MRSDIVDASWMLFLGTEVLARPYLDEEDSSNEVPVSIMIWAQNKDLNRCKLI